MNLKYITKIFLSIVITFFAQSSFAFDPVLKPITVIIPFAPGGGADRVFRMLEQYCIDKHIKFVPLYKPGADGTIGLRELSKSLTDGYTISITTSGVVASYEIAYPDKPIEIITGVSDTVGAFVVSSQSGIDTIKDLEKSVHNGDNITFGYGAPAQKIMLNEFFKISKPTKEPVLVGYKGGSQVVNDLVGGHITAARIPFVLVKGFVDSGNLKVLTVTRNKVPGYNIPTMESIYPSWKEVDGYGVLVPKNTNADAVKFWSEFLKAYLEDKSVQQSFVDNQMVGLPFGPTEFKKIVKETKSWILN